MKLDFDKILKNEVEQLFGQRLSDKYSCEMLSARIQKEIGESISYQTLRRFWNLTRSQNSISLQSKNILCKYLGFKDLTSFRKYAASYHNGKNTIDWIIVKEWYTINKHDEPLENSIYWHNKLSQTFAQFILTNEFVFDSFTKAMHTNDVAMKYIISYHPMYDQLASAWYLRGVNLFVRNSSVLHYKLFDVCLQFMHEVFTCHEFYLADYAQQIEDLLTRVRKEFGLVWPLEARSISSLLYFYRKVNQMEKFQHYKAYCIDLIHHYQNISFEIDNQDIYLFYLCDYCNMYGMYDISRELLLEYSLGFSENTLWRSGYNQASLIVEAFYLFQTGCIDESKKKFEKVSLEVLNFNFKKYFSIQYHLLALGFCSRNAHAKKDKIKRIINQLIEDTGLVYFRQFISIFE